MTVTDDQAVPLPPGKHKASKLTTLELHELDVACEIISAAFDSPPYLVGTAGAFAESEGYRDVDVRLILGDEDFAVACPTRDRWELLCVAISMYLRDRTGLPVDFQIQRRTEANERFQGPRNPLGLTRRGRRIRVFAGGGDATPDWEESGS